MKTVGNDRVNVDSAISLSRSVVDLLRAVINFGGKEVRSVHK